MMISNIVISDRTKYLTFLTVCKQISSHLFKMLSMTNVIKNYIFTIYVYLEDLELKILPILICHKKEKTTKQPILFYVCKQMKSDMFKMLQTNYSFINRIYLI